MFEQKGLSLASWVEIYEKKTGERADFPEGYRLFYLAERGFALMKPCPEDKMMIIYEVCGDAKFFRDLAEIYACSMGLEYISTICTRHIKPYIRAFGWKILEQQEKDGQYRFICSDSIGRLVIITHMCINDVTQEPQYHVTQYLNVKATTDIDEFLASENKGGNN